MSANSNELPAASYSSSWPPTRVNLDEIQIFPDLFSSRKGTLASPCLQAGEASTEASDLHIDSSTVPSRVTFKLCFPQFLLQLLAILAWEALIHTLLSVSLQECRPPWLQSPPVQLRKPPKQLQLSPALQPQPPVTQSHRNGWIRVTMLGK